MSSSPAAHRRERMLAIAILLCLVGAVHGQQLGFPFLPDDVSTLVQNPVVCQPRWLPDLLGPSLSAQQIPGAGQPAMLASAMLDCASWGMRPWGFHLSNLLWHAAATSLLFLGLSGLWGGRARAGDLPLVVAALFAVHPINVEAVAAVSHRADLLAGTLALLALSLLTRARTRPTAADRWGHRLAGFVAASVACLAKESSYVLPVLLVLLDVWPRPDRRSFAAITGQWRTRAGEWLTAVAAVVWVFAWRTWIVAIEPAGLASGSAHESPIGLGARIGEGSFGLASGVAKLIVPFGFYPEYPTPDAWTFVHLLLRVLAAAVVLAMIVVTIALARRQPRVTLGLAFGLVAYLPMFGLVELSNARADRYFYLPAMGFLLALAAGVHAMAQAISDWRYRRRDMTDGNTDGPGQNKGQTVVSRSAMESWMAQPLVVLLVVLTVGGLGWRAWRQSWVWASADNLWATAIKNAPTSPRAWAGVATMFLDQHHSVQALEAAKRAAMLAPEQPTGYELMGLSWLRQGSTATACAYLQLALEKSGTRPDIKLLNNLGYCKNQLGKFDEALALFKQARQIAPWYDRSWLNAATALQQAGRIDEARTLLDEFVREHNVSPREARQLRTYLERKRR